MGGDPKPVVVVRVVGVPIVAGGDTRVVRIVVPRAATQPPVDLSLRYQACAWKRPGVIRFPDWSSLGDCSSLYEQLLTR